MDFEKEEQAFYSRLEADPLSDSAIALWHALRAISKVVGRTEGLSVPQGTLCAKAGLRNPKSLERARNQLVSRGLLEWRARGKDKATMYTLVPVTRQNAPQNVTRQNEAQNGVQSGVHSGAENGVHSGAENGVHSGALYTTTTVKEVVDITRQNEAQNGVQYGVHSGAGVTAPTGRPLMTDDDMAGAQAGLDAVERLAREIGLNYGDYQTINRLAADYTVDWCIAALNRARLNAKGVPSWRYVEGILKRWREGGCIDELGSTAPEATRQDAEARRRQEAREEAILRGEYT